MSDRALPGGDLIREGIADLARNVDSVSALLVSIGAPRLRAMGFDLPRTIDRPALACSGCAQKARTPPMRSTNALIRRRGSHPSLHACARSGVRRPTRVYFTGGATAVLFGWRQPTTDKGAPA